MLRNRCGENKLSFVIQGYEKYRHREKARDNYQFSHCFLHPAKKSMNSLTGVNILTEHTSISSRFSIAQIRKLSEMKRKKQVPYEKRHQVREKVASVSRVDNTKIFYPRQHSCRG